MGGIGSFVPEHLQVPKELHEDLLIIADKIEPYARMVVEKAEQLEDNAADLAAKIEPAAEKLGAKMEQGAHEVRLAKCALVFHQCALGLDVSQQAVCKTESALHSLSEPIELALALACCSSGGGMPFAYVLPGCGCNCTL